MFNRTSLFREQAALFSLLREYEEPQAQEKNENTVPERPGLPTSKRKNKIPQQFQAMQQAKHARR